MASHCHNNSNYKGTKVDHEDNDDDDCNYRYEPEYEWETVTVPWPPSVVVGDSSSSTNEPQPQPPQQPQQQRDFAVLSVLPPPLEYLSTLHTQHQEISGRQVWTGSLWLAQYLMMMTTTTMMMLWGLGSRSCGCGDNSSSSSHLPPPTAEWWKRKRILELGCGTGILGMILAHFLADHHKHLRQHYDSRPNAVVDPSSSSSSMLPACLVLTDGDEQALELLQQNLIRNHIVSSKNDDATTTTTVPLGFPVHFTRLLWGTDHPDTLHSFQAWCHETLKDGTTTNQPTSALSSSLATDEAITTTKTTTTNRTTTSFPFDVIVAGDVLYKPELIPLFFATARALLLPPSSSSTTTTTTTTCIRTLPTDANDDDDGGGGSLWLCHVPRFTVTHDCVVQGAQQAGFTVKVMADGNDFLKDATDTAASTILGCPAADVCRAKIYRMRLQKE